MNPASQPDLFIDGMLDVSFARGTVRVDLYSLSATEKHSNGQPKPEFRQRMVMSATSFVEFVGGLQLAVQSLREKGALPPAPTPVAAPAPSAEPAAAAPPPPPPQQPAKTNLDKASLDKGGAPRSPNFAPRAEEE